MSTPATIVPQRLPTVVLVGRVNVGKSSLFNRLVEEKRAIVSPIPGTTRTRNEGTVLWRGREFRIVDTGGLTFDERIPLESEIIRQTELAFKDADLIILVVEADVPLLSQERIFVSRIRETHVPALLLVNKTDNTRVMASAQAEPWARLGLGDPLYISAKNGRGVGDMLDRVARTLGRGIRRPKQAETRNPDEIRVAIIGKPNVGKSSLFNAVIGEERVIVSPIAHTTREPHDTRVLYADKDTPSEAPHAIVFVDTAGIRRKARVEGDIERQGIGKSIAAAKEADIVLLVLDAADPVSVQDRQLGALLSNQKKSVIIIINKWDLARAEEDAAMARKEMQNIVRSFFPHVAFAPILFVSAKTGWNIPEIFPAILHAWRARHTELPEAAIETIRRFAVSRHLPTKGKGTRHPRVMTMRQLGVHPPVFEVIVSYGTSLHHSYLDYLERIMREQCDFYATPLTLLITKLKR